jgi:E3 ubiquitin-protein ligase HUWE1
MLLQNCGNRSIYASSSHLNSLLNSTSLPLLENTLLLGSELAQRYQAAVKRSTAPSRHAQSALLANHYNIDLDRVLQLSRPFTKTTPIPAESVQPATPATPTVKGKEKASFNIPVTPQKSVTATTHANDLVSLVKGGASVNSSPKGVRNGLGSASASHPENIWEEWGDVKVTYYPKPITDIMESANITNTPRTADTPAAPITPTPIRRSSNLGPHSQRASRVSSSDDSPVSLTRSSTFPTEDAQHPNFKVIEIPLSNIKSTGIHDLLRENGSGLPQELQYELLTKLRVADALTSSLETRRQLLAVRLLAITNLAYVHSETTFHDNVLKQDSDEPRRLQLVYQLAELVHPPAEGDVAVPQSLQTIAFSTLDALSQHQARFPDICAALNTNVSHGVLLYVVRKAVAEMSRQDVGDEVSEQDEWRDALFSLLSNISMMHRAGGDLVTAGLIPVLVEVLELRTTVAERYYPKVLAFLDQITYSGRDALQTIVSGEILDAVSNLIVYEVNAASESVASGKGMRPEYRSASVDYEIPHFQQQTIKWLFKFIHHMMTGATGFGANFDRLLRNLIDSSQLLDSLRRIIENAHTFGSTVWTNAVSILNDFINNEPTSFAVIAEAGLSRGLLEAVTGKPIVMPSDSKKGKASPDQEASEETHTPQSADDEDDDSDDNEIEQASQRPSPAMLQIPREEPLARGILPTSETINIVPQAFGAICLNNAGMKMFQASRALDSFFEIFESPEHVKCMENNADLPSNLGSTFDELVRHHPPLKTDIMNAIVHMVARVSYLCKTKGEKGKKGAKLWTVDASGKAIVADEQLKEAVDRSFKGKGKAVDNGSDVEMLDVESEAPQIPDNQLSTHTDPNADMTPYITAVATFLGAMFSNSSVRSDFSSKGGMEYLLDLADSPCLTYEFVDSRNSQNLHQVIALLAEQKPHLTLPSLLQRAQAAADVLAPFAEHEGPLPFFKPFVDRDTQQPGKVDLLAKGTSFVKAFVNLHSLVSTLHSCLQSTAHGNRNSIGFNALNLGDYYARLLHSLGPLLGASLREEYELNKAIPDYYKNAVRVKDSGFGESIVDLILGSEPPSPPTDSVSQETLPTEQINGDAATALATNSSTPGENKPKSLTKAERDSPEFKNFQTIRYLLSKMSRTISPFFQTLGKCLVSKRGVDDYQKWSHAAIADALVETILQQLGRYEERSVENLTFWIGMIHVLKDMLIECKTSKYPNYSI